MKACVLNIGGQEVILDPANLKFDDRTLTSYLMQEGGWYNYFGEQLANAEREYAEREAFHDQLYALKFYQYKCDGGTEKMCESRTKIDPDVKKAHEEVRDAKLRVNLIKNHLKAWDKNHENAQSVGHTLRREMSRLGTDSIREPESFRERGCYDDIEGMVKPLGGYED